jgi:RNA polymerase sigma factor (sigma-70 family)
MAEADSAPSGLEAIFLTNRDMLLRFLRARGAGEIAEDLLQEVWLRASVQPSGPIANPQSYLFRIANNLMIDYHRSETQRRARERSWVESCGSDAQDVSDEPSAEAGMIAQNMLAKVGKAIDGLGEPTTTIFRRFRLDGVPQKAIAAELAISLATVEKHLQKAYKAVVAIKNELEAD